MRHTILLGGLLLALAACAGRDEGRPPPDATASPSTEAPASSPAAGAPDAGAAAEPASPGPLARREGQALVRSAAENVLYLADEDHSAVRRIPLTEALSTPPPFTDKPAPTFADANETRLDLPGRPAQVLVTGERLLVTVRDPGTLIVFSTGEAPQEIARVPLPADAWGIAVSPDGSAAYVTSAWTHTLSRVDLGAMRVAWSVDVAREPRGVAVTADGKKVYVTHLVGADLTRVDVTGEPQVSRVAFPADPLRTFAGDTTVSASLGYAAVLSPDGRRLFVARQALGALWSWQGNSTVDVLATATDEPIAMTRGGKPLGQVTQEELRHFRSWADHAGSFAVGTGELVQPRAMVYREKTRHLLVAAEGDAALVELDAMSTAPAVVFNRIYRLGGLAPEEPTKIQIPPHCGAPTGVALSAGEDVAWVYCRSTDNVVAVRLTPDGERGVSSETWVIENARWKHRLSPWGPFAYARLSVPELPESLALGRRLFYDATEPVVSQQMGCAGCHPEGRDDGHVWREHGEREGADQPKRFRAGPTLARSTFDDSSSPDEPFGVARQTPMLAGRVSAAGPYGWHAESATLVDRIRAGFSLHRKYEYPVADGLTKKLRAEPIAEFLRRGLVPPPREAREPTAEEQRGKEIFESPRTRCARCHVPASEFTDRSTMPLRGFKALRFFDEDPKRDFKVPSLLYVGGTPPYYHDGSAATLADLVEHNQDRMGKTSHLDAADRAALVAYLRTL